MSWQFFLLNLFCSSLGESLLAIGNLECLNTGNDNSLRKGDLSVVHTTMHNWQRKNIANFGYFVKNSNAADLVIKCFLVSTTKDITFPDNPLTGGLLLSLPGRGPPRATAGAPRARESSRGLVLLPRAPGAPGAHGSSWGLRELPGPLGARHGLGPLGARHGPGPLGARHGPGPLGPVLLPLAHYLTPLASCLTALTPCLTPLAPCSHIEAPGTPPPMWGHGARGASSTTQGARGSKTGPWAGQRTLGARHSPRPLGARHGLRPLGARHGLRLLGARHGLRPLGARYGPRPLGPVLLPLAHCLTPLASCLTALTPCLTPLPHALT